MTRIPLSKTHEMRVLHRKPTFGKQVVVVALHELGDLRGTLAVPLELLDRFQAAVAAIRPPGPEEGRVTP